MYTYTFFIFTLNCGIPGTFKTEIIIRSRGVMSSMEERCKISLRKSPSTCPNNPTQVAAPGPKPASNGKQSK